jgi:hypothetical protein
MLSVVHGQYPLSLDYIDRHKFVRVPHAPHSPDLASSGFYLFGSLTGGLRNVIERRKKSFSEISPKFWTQFQKKNSFKLDHEIRTGHQHRWKVYPNTNVQRLISLASSIAFMAIVKTYQRPHTATPNANNVELLFVPAEPQEDSNLWIAEYLQSLRLGPEQNLDDECGTLVSQPSTTEKAFKFSLGAGMRFRTTTSESCGPWPKLLSEQDLRHILIKITHD